MSRTLSLFAVMLSGCPYIFGPPEIGKGDEDTAVVRDTATAGQTDSTIPPTTNPQAPRLSGLSTSARYEHTLLDFQVTDMDGDLVGAALRVDRGGTTHEFVIPSDLDTWEQFGTSTVSVPMQPPCDGYAEAWEVTLTDLSGATSPIATVGSAVDGYGKMNPGDSDLGPLAHPAIVCGLGSKDGGVDSLSFSPPDELRLQFELYWSNPSTDLDLVLLQDGVELGRSLGASPAPEVVTTDLRAGIRHTIEVRHWEGPHSEWQLFVWEP